MTIEKKAHVWARNDLDWYQEPERVTTQLLREEEFQGPIVDPCCGAGNIVKALKGAGLEAYGHDVKDRTNGAPWFQAEEDFLTSAGRWSNMVMNPPYFGGKGTEAFIRHAFPLVQRKLCVFVDRRFLTGKGRAQGLYSELPPSRVWEITPRPSCPPGEWIEAGNKAGGGTADYCWLVWDRDAPRGLTRLGWLSDVKPVPDFVI